MSSFNDFVQLVESFEQYLGNPEANDTPITFEQSLIFDEQESLAWPQIHYAQQWGYMDYLIPSDLGGKLDSLVLAYFFTKSLARRDITTAIALGLSFFAALPIWFAGSLEQKKELAARMRQGQIGALALTEEAHGSDLTANEMSALQNQNGWELSGQKWCINFATKGDMTTALCRTHPKGGLLGFSLFFIDKQHVGEQYQTTPKLHTHGVRGLDISGFILDKVQLSKDALIGKEGKGLELIYKVFQMSRTVCACFCVGGADTALRLAVSFSLQRHLYGKTAYDITAVKQRLGEQFVQLLIADCTSLIVVRACTVMPEKMSFWSAIIKFLIPKITEDIVEQCSLILGARGYLRTTQWATLQKIRRDIQIVGLFDGSSQVNLSLIAGNLLPQANKRGTPLPGNTERLQTLFNIQQKCPDFGERGLGLFTHDEDDVVAGIHELDSPLINHLITSVRTEIIRLDNEVLSLQKKKRFDPRSLKGFRLAEQYSWIFAASCCLQFWHYNHEWLSAELKDTQWLTLAIQLIINRIRSNEEVDSELQELMAGHLCSYYQDKRMFSVIPTHVMG